MVTALYRRYRPETFAEMIGQSQVTEPLMTALRTNRVNHAYLFSGPRGCGKTTSARILARCLNCAEGPTDTPCGKCPSCVELGRGGQGSLDVVEIDAASHNGVDDARDIRERAIFAPARDRYKIFILDEAHMVTSAGFNALLKIVEEPPEHVKFIFATTEPEKVIGTIRSRTHHYPFRLVPPALMLDYVQKLTDEEGMKVAPGVLPLVVRAGGGSPRDTLSLLDQLIAGSEGDEIGYERAVSLLGYTHSALLDEIVEAMAARDSATAFAAVDRVIQTGQDPRRFVEDLLERLRDLIIIAAAGPDRAAAVLRGTPQDELERMGLEARGFGAAELSRIADIVNAALTEMSGATAPRLHLELMIARALVPSADEPGAIARVERLERRVGVTDAAPPAPRVAQRPPAAARNDTAPASTASIAGAVSAESEQADPGRVDPAPVNTASAAESAPVESERVESASADPAPIGSAPAGAGAAGATPLGAAPAGVPVPPAAPAPPAAGLPPEKTGGWATPGVTGVDGDQPAPAASAPAATPSAPGAETPVAKTPAAAQPGAPVGPVTLQHIRDVWPQIVESLKNSDRRAWMVVFTATVRKFENDVLTLTFPSENDIASFRPQPGGAQNVSEVLREAIQKLLGVRVKFVAKTATDFAQSLKAEGFGVTLPAAPQPAPERPQDASRNDRGESGGAETPAPRSAPSAEPAVAPKLSAVPSAVQPKNDSPVTSWAVAAIPGAGSAAAAAAPAPVEAPVEAPRPRLQAVPPLPAEQPEAEQSEEKAAVDASVDDEGWAIAAPLDDDAPSFEEDPDAAPPAPVVAERSEAPRSEVVEARPMPARPGPTFSSEPDPRERSPLGVPGAASHRGAAAQPGTQRYGEAVVREVLNARFIEEQPLDDGGR
ncbi:MAG TPA: DNA polymerase III subunit gamma and tau [Gryllotalpicola sp.]